VASATATRPVHCQLTNTRRSNQLHAEDDLALSIVSESHRVHRGRREKLIQPLVVSTAKGDPSMLASRAVLFAASKAAWQASCQDWDVAVQPIAHSV
jgi:hypothetical protein